MASTGVNILRWSALGAGAIYGLYHQSQIKARDAAAKADAEWKHKESLISQAKAEWAKQQQGGDNKASGSNTDSKSPNADLNALLGITDKN